MVELQNAAAIPPGIDLLKIIHWNPLGTSGTGLAICLPGHLVTSLSQWVHVIIKCHNCAGNSPLFSVP
jgi:hypothetical protein